MTMPGAQVKRLPRPTAGVTADRLAYALRHWPYRFTRKQRQAAEDLINLLNKIAEDPDA